MVTYTQAQLDSMARLKASNAKATAGDPSIKTNTSSGLKVNYTPTSSGQVFNPATQQQQELDAYNASLKKTAPTAPVSPTSPINPPTVSDIYGGLIKPTDSTLNDAYQTQADIYKEQTAPVDEAAIRQKTMAQFQAEIDALNTIYAQKKQEEYVAGQSRLGSASAIQARSGLLGSDFGAAQTEKTTQYNRDIQSSIDAEKAYKIQEVLGRVNTEAKQEIEAKKAARLQGATAYIEYLKSANERKDALVSSTLDNVIYSGLEPDDALFKELATKLGVSVETLKAQYNKSKASRTEETKPITETIDGTLLVYNPETKKYEPQYSAAKDAAKPITQVVGGNMLQYNNATGNWDTIFVAPEKAVDLKKVTVNGVDYFQDADGNLITPKTPTAPTTQRIDQAQKIKDTAKSILESPNWNNAVGPISATWPERLRSGERNAVDAKIKLLQGLLTLPNLGILKGPMSDKDIEFIRNASTAGLATNINEAEFKRIMEGIIADADKVITNAGTKQPNPQQEEINTMRKQLQGEGYPPDEVEAAIKAEYPSFNNESQTSLNGTAQKIAAIPDNSKGGQCGRFVNQLTGLGLGDSYESKMSKMDPSITEPAPGMAFVMPYSWTGHTGFILDVYTNEDGEKMATVKDSNYFNKSAPEKIKTHDIPVSKMTGFTMV